MNRIQHTQLLAATLAAIALALLAFTAAATAALASHQPPVPPGRNKHPPLPHGHPTHQPVHQIPVPGPVHTVIAGGMPGWQITLIAAGAAILAACAAVALDRARTARRHLTAPGT